MSRDLCFQSSSLVDTVPAAFPQQKSVKFFDMLYKLLPFHIITLLGINKRAKGVKGKVIGYLGTRSRFDETKSGHVPGCLLLSKGCALMKTVSRKGAKNSAGHIKTTMFNFEWLMVKYRIKVYGFPSCRA